MVGVDKNGKLNFLVELPTFNAPENPLAKLYKLISDLIYNGIKERIKT